MPRIISFRIRLLVRLGLLLDGLALADASEGLVIGLHIHEAARLFIDLDEAVGGGVVDLRALLDRAVTGAVAFLPIVAMRVLLTSVK